MKTKTRRVLLTIEVDTDIPLARLRNSRFLTLALGARLNLNGIRILVHQAQANVVRQKRLGNARISAGPKSVVRFSKKEGKRG